MPNEQGMSKRQLLREKRQREAQRNRLISIGIVVLGALLVAFFMIYPNLKPVKMISVTPRAYSQVDGTALGSADAKVVVEVWEDFQCPACRNYTQNTEPQIIQNYVETGKVRYIFHNYPFIDSGGAGQESHTTANAAMCASEQGRFWEFHELIFANWNGENLGTFSNRLMIALAESLSLDMNAFKSCFSENRYSTEIEKDFTDGKELGVNSTPSIFVNRTIVLSAQDPRYVPSYEDIAAAIEAALTAK